MMIYSNTFNFTGILLVNHKDYLMDNLKPIRKGIQSVRKIYPKLLDENRMWRIYDDIEILVEKEVIDWIAYTIYDFEQNKVLQEWRYEFQNSSNDLVDIPSNILLTEIPYNIVEKIHLKVNFICHISLISCLSQEQRDSILSEVPISDSKLINKNAYPNNIFLHTQNDFKNSYCIRQNSTVINFDNWLNTEWQSVAKFPSKCTKGKEYELELVLCPEHVNNLAISSEESLQLIIVVTGQDFKVNSSYYHNIEIPIKQLSETVVFKLSPKHNAIVGEKIIIVDFFLEGIRIENIVIKTKIYNQASEILNNDEIVNYPGSLDIHPNILNQLPSNSFKSVTLLARSIEDGIQYTVSGSNHVINIGKGKIIDQEHRKLFIKDFQSQTSRFIQTDSSLTIDDNRYKNILIQLKILGTKLYQLFPKENFHDYFSNLDAGTIILIHKTEELQWIPWEIIYDRDKELFWGEKFIITRLPERLISKKQTIPNRIEFFSNKIHFLSTYISGKADYVERAEEAISHNISNYSCIKDSSRVEFVDKLKNVFGSSILHFTCHCSIDTEDRPALVLGKCVDDGLTVEMIQTIKFNNIPFIFANACTTERYYEDWFKESVNFGFTALDNGVQAFIGTIGILPVQLAIEFSEVFYKNLITERMSIGKALWETKKTFSQRNNPFWLFYCLYGDATVYLSEKQLDETEVLYSSM